MIISKDLFIFGEQIFATIIPEGGSTTTTTTTAAATTQDLQLQQQQEAIFINAIPVIPTTPATPTITTITPTAGTATAEQVVGPLKTAIATIASAAAATTIIAPPLITQTTTTVAAAKTTNTLYKQETVAVVVGAASGAASATKTQKIPKEAGAELQQQLQQTQAQAHNQSHQKGSINENGLKGGQIFEKHHEQTKAEIVVVTVGAAETAAADEDDEEEKEEEEAEAIETEQEPLVKRSTIKTTATAAVSPATVSAATGTAVSNTTATESTTSFALQQQHQQQREATSPLLLRKMMQLQQQQQQQSKQPQADCHLQLELEAPLPAMPTIKTASNNATAAAATTTITTAAAAVDQQQRRILNAEDPKSPLNLGKTGMLGNSCRSNNTSNRQPTRSDHAMVTFPFISEQQRTLQLSFQNVNVLHNDRKILSDVSGLVSPGEVLAIMGPSGSGKTTLLDSLSGQRRIDSGSIHLNREPLSKKWRRKICYVLQEEVFFSGLTLRETVMYTALLRLPEKMPKEEKMKLVDHILEALELNFCQQTKFGDYLNRGLSGGEKKRANIACELLTNPLLMLLDEPTSGLDSHSAISLMKVLKRYAMQEQKTVVITVHQPSSQMFHMFDKLLLLYNGRTAYFGEVNNIYSYFEDIGVAIKPHYNPADFVLEQLKSFPDIREKLFVAAKESHGNFLNRNCITVNTNNQVNHQHHNNHNHIHNQHHQHQHNNHQQHQNGLNVTSQNSTSSAAVYGTTTVAVNDKSHQHDTLINDIINNYYYNNDKVHCNHNHNHNHHINHDDLLMLGNHHNSCQEEAAQQLWVPADSQSNFSSTSSDCQHEYEDAGDWLDYPTRFHTQFRVLSSRNFKEAKPRMLSKLNWFQTVGLALMAGAIWFQIPRTEEFLHDLQGWMFFSQTYWMLFALFGALNSFPSEREVISKERRSGAYRLSAYYLAKMFGELPLVITLPTVYLMISYPMLGCTSFKLFFLMLVFLLLNTIVAQSVGFFIGACCMDMNVSITLSALYTLATQLFGGYLSSRIPEGLSWIRYTSMIHYAYQNMQILEFREGPAIRCGEPSSFEICKNKETTFIPYDEILKAQNSTSPLWLNTLVLMMFFLVFRGLGYAVLRYVRCPKT